MIRDKYGITVAQVYEILSLPWFIWMVRTGNTSGGRTAMVRKELFEEPVVKPEIFCMVVQTYFSNWGALFYTGGWRLMDKSRMKSRHQLLPSGYITGPP